MTSYHITLGYSYDGDDYEIRWGAVEAIVADLRSNTHVIADEAIRLGCPPEGHGDGLGEYLAGYLPGSDDCTIMVHNVPGIDPEDEGAGYMEVCQLASGGEPGRSIKHHLRRAFCRLVMERAHRLGIEVNINVH